MAEKTFDIETVNQIILFDGVCNLCNGAVNFIIDRDPKAKFRFASLQSATGQEYLRQHQLPVHELKSLVLVSGNKSYLRSTAALRIARELSGAWPLFYLFIVIPAPVRNLLYDLIAKYRYRLFGKSDTCRYPSADLKSRFLEV
ncbi:MAG: thiol-disulfide oxidoreductase DCC family protein [Cyclobacteriaceae bacterium]